MKLSEAIRAGAKKRPQTFKAVFKNVPGLGVCSCALGAAYEALQGHTTPDSYWAGIEQVSNKKVLKQKVLCPVSNCVELETTGKLIEHLNDDHWWTREAIADWLEKIESE